MTFGGFTKVFVVLAVLGFDSSRACSPDSCPAPWADVEAFFRLTNRIQECSTFETCMNTELQTCPRSFATNALKALVRGAARICPTVTRDDVQGIQTCDANKFSNVCMVLVDSTQGNNKSRCLAVGKTYDCFDEYLDSCNVKLAKDFVSFIKPTFKDIEEECKAQGFQIHDGGSVVQPTLVSILTGAVYIVLRYAL